MTMTERQDIDRAVSIVLDQMGVRAISHGDRAVTGDSNRDAYTVRLALPPRVVEVKLEREPLVSTRSWSDYVIEQLDTGARRLFAETVEHIAKHDRSPVDRLRDVEAASKALLDALDVNLDEIRMPHGVSNRVLSAAWKLRELLQAKSGSASWSRNGYGQGPDPEVAQP